jgi:Protein of unknown function (DUF3667)
MDKILHTCKNCSNSFSGKFCNQCGEKVYSEQDKSIAHLFHEVFHFFTHFDGALFLTLKTIIKTPGKYSLDFCNGIRKKYFKPIPLFLLIVILYLLFPMFKGLNMQAKTYVDSQYDYGWFALPVVKYKMKKQAVTYEKIAELYDAKSPKIAKLGMLLLIPMSALVIMLLFYKSKRLYFDHFILSAEINSFLVLFNYLFVPLIATIMVYFSPGLERLFFDDSWLWIVLVSVFAVFIVIAFRRFYAQRWSWSILKGFIFLAVFAVGIRYVYAMIVFYLTMLFV